MDVQVEAWYDVSQALYTKRYMVNSYKSMFVYNAMGTALVTSQR